MLKDTPTTGIRVLMVTTEWPTSDRPLDVPFLVQRVDALRRAGVEVRVLHFRGERNVAHYLRAWRTIHREMAHQTYDLVDAQWGQSALPVLPSQLPLVVTFRGTDLEGYISPNGRPAFSGRVLALISRFMAARANHVIVVSERLAKRLPDCAYTVIPSGLDLELFRPMSTVEARRRLDLDPDRRYVLFAANPDKPLKRFHLARAAVGRLQTPGGAELLVANGVPQDEMPFYMNAADILLLTSTHEGSPNVVKEALACNTPVVSLDVGDVRERLESVEGCRICPDDSAESIAAALDTTLAHGRPICGREAVLSLDEGALTRKVIEVYHAVLDRQALVGNERRL